MTPVVASLLISVAVLPVALWIAWGLPRHERVGRGQTPGKITLPHPILLGICLYVFGTTLTEGAVADWSAIYMRDVFASTPGIGGLAVTAFSLAVALTRLAGDRLKLRFGPAQLARALAAVGLVGVVFVVFRAA